MELRFDKSDNTVFFNDDVYLVFDARAFNYLVNLRLRAFGAEEF